MIHYRRGNITQATEAVIAHGVNCEGDFGGRVGNAIKRVVPYVSDQYLRAHGHVLGTCQFVAHRNKTWVHAHTQQDKGYVGKQEFADLESVAKCLVEIDDYMKLHKLTTIAMPRIGCAYGGLPWQAVEILVAGILEDHAVFVYDFDEVPKKKRKQGVTSEIILEDSAIYAANKRFDDQFTDSEKKSARLTNNVFYARAESEGVRDTLGTSWSKRVTSIPNSPDSDYGRSYYDKFYAKKNEEK